MIENNFYMDDLIGGGDDIEKVKYLRAVLHEELAKCGFVLRKYQSNSKEILDAVPSDL